MAQVARKRKESVQPRRRPDLLVVDGKSIAKPTMSAASMRMGFWVVAICAVLFAMFGLGRIYLSSLATNAAIQSSEITANLREANAASDALELKQSVLSRPDRIKTYAATNLKMGPAKQVSQIDISPEKTRVVAQVEDTNFESTPSNKKSGDGIVGLVKNLFSPIEAGAGVVSQP